MAFAGANGGMQLLGWWNNHVKVEGFPTWMPDATQPFLEHPFGEMWKPIENPVNCFGFQKIWTNQLFVSQAITHTNIQYSLK